MTEGRPLSRVVRVDALPHEGQTVTIEATPAEREALASFFKLPAIAILTATLRVEPWGRGGRESPALSAASSPRPAWFRSSRFPQLSTRPSTCGSRLRPLSIPGFP